jgi:hypothetical protein
MFKFRQNKLSNLVATSPTKTSKAKDYHTYWLESVSIEFFVTFSMSTVMSKLTNTGVPVLDLL